MISQRFAINALKVQDNLSRLSKELPIAAIDVCKSFSINYTDNAVAVCTPSYQEHNFSSKIFDLSFINILLNFQINDTIASLNSEEVTEMEVQVDPMVFLEDDQIDDSNQDLTQNSEQRYACI